MSNINDGKNQKDTDTDKCLNSDNGFLISQIDCEYNEENQEENQNTNSNVNSIFSFSNKKEVEEHNDLENEDEDDLEGEDGFEHNSEYYMNAFDDNQENINLKVNNKEIIKYSFLHSEYLNFEQIYNIYLFGKSKKERNELFLDLMELLEYSSEHQEVSLLLFNLVLDNLEFDNQDDPNKFLEYLNLETIFKLYNQRSYHKLHNLEAEVAYFIELEILDKLDENGSILIENIPEYHNISYYHEFIQDLVLETFNYKEEIALYLKEKNNEQKIEGKLKHTYNIINNVIFENDILPFDKVYIQEKLMNTDSKIQYIKNRDNAMFNILNSLIHQNKENFLINVELYVNYHKSINNKNTLSIEDIISLFFYTENHETETLIETLFSHYNEEIFTTFMNTYNIPKNIVIKKDVMLVNSNSLTSLYLPLIELALYKNRYDIVESLISLGYGLEPFSQKIITNDNGKTDVVLNFNYIPYQNIDYYKEQDFFILIKNGIIDEHTKINYIECEKGETDNPQNYYCFNNSIFYYFIYKDYTNAFIELYTHSINKNPKFLLKNYSQAEVNKSDLLIYYLSQINHTNDYNSKLFDIFLNEKYSISNKLKRNELISKLMDMDYDLMTEVVYYLYDVFSDKDKKETIFENESYNLYNITSKKEEPIEWFNMNNLKSHYKKISKDKESSNKDYISSMITNEVNVKKDLVIEDESFFDDLKQQFPNFEEVINFYKSQFRLRKLSGKRHITPVLLLGDPGIGKTYFSKKLAEYLNTGYTFLDMASVTANWILTGNNGTWKSAKQGKILEAMVNSPTISPIFLMDEIEKCKGGDYDPTMALYQLLEEINAKSFNDEFIDFSFDASSIIYIACANTLGKLSEPLQSRFKIFNINKPNEQEFINIINNIYKEAVKSAKIFNTELSSEIIETLKGENIRTVKLMIDEAVGKALLELDMKSINKTSHKNSINLKKEHFKEPIKKRAIGYST